MKILPNLLSDALYISNDQYEQPKHIVVTPRIGVSYVKGWAGQLLRFYIQDNPFVSNTQFKN